RSNFARHDAAGFSISSELPSPRGKNRNFNDLAPARSVQQSVEGAVHRTILLAPIGQESSSWHGTSAWIRTRAPSRCLRHAIYGFKPLSRGNRVLRAGRFIPALFVQVQYSRSKVQS